jgi:DNA-binding NarL/FixJ family response regulator
VTIRVVIADDQQLVRAGLCGIVDSAADLDVVGDAEDGGQAVALAGRLQPDVVLMDVRMPGMDGIEATGLVTSTTAAKVLILSTFDLDEYVFAALRAGASGFLLKDTPPAVLLDGIRLVAAGEALLSPSATRALIAEFARQPAAASPAVRTEVSITDRERDVLLLVAEGLSNTEIGSRLFITPGTVKTHVAHLLAKVGVRDRAQLVIYAFRTGLAS